MAKSLFREALQFLPVIAALVLIETKPLFAQESPIAALMPASTEPVPRDTVEIASVEPVPSAPENANIFAGPPIFPASAAAMEPMALVPATVPSKERSPHPFWDRKNRALFATVGALAAVDFYATHANLASGGKELNPVTRMFSGSTPGLATNFALEAGSVIGVSYLFHRTGHHKLERITALVNIGSSGGAAGYSLAHR